MQKLFFGCLTQKIELEKNRFESTEQKINKKKS